MNVELVFCQQYIQAPVVGSDFCAGKAPYLCLCNVCVESYPRTEGDTRDAALGYVCCRKISLFTMCNLAFVCRRMCLISWFPAGRRLKETLMRSLLLPQDYLKDRGERNCYLFGSKQGHTFGNGTE